MTRVCVSKSSCDQHEGGFVGDDGAKRGTGSGRPASREKRKSTAATAVSWCTSGGAAGAWLPIIHILALLTYIQFLQDRNFEVLTVPPWVDSGTSVFRHPLELAPNGTIRAATLADKSLVTHPFFSVHADKKEHNLRRRFLILRTGKRMYFHLFPQHEERDVERESHRRAEDEASSVETTNGVNLHAPGKRFYEGEG